MQKWRAQNDAHKMTRRKKQEKRIRTEQNRKSQRQKLRLFDYVRKTDFKVILFALKFYLFW